MQQQNQDIAQRFLVSAIAHITRIFLTPLYYAIRSDMGVQFTAFYPIAMSLVVHKIAAEWLAFRSETDGGIAALYVALIALGYIRNAMEASRRRQTRDWSVHSWSTGTTILEPLSFFACRRIYRIWGKRPFAQRLVRVLLSIDFLHYVAEPVMLLALAAALWSIGSHLYGYPSLMALGLIFVRYDSQLRSYLQAHEIADAKMLEREVMSEFEGSPLPASACVTVAQLPLPPTGRPTTDERSVFKRLSPELQMLLMRDRATNP